MSQLFVGSICLSDIPKEKVITARNGKAYVNITIWVNDTADQYGNVGSMHISQTKDERETNQKRSYMGNFKIPVPAATQPTDSADPQPVPEQTSLPAENNAWTEFLSR
jgi:hypothetical protein